MKRPIAKVLARAASGPINLSVIGAAVLGAVALASWPIAALGGVAYAALVAADVANPGFRRQVMFGRDRPTRLPRPSDVKDPEVRQIVTAIVAARAEIDKVAKETPDRVKRNVSSSLRSIEELEGHAAALVTRAEDLSKYLESIKTDDAPAEADRLKKHASSAKDATARREYELAAASADERVRAVSDIAAARDRVLANLSRVVATLRGVPPKLVRLRALDDQASDSLSGDVGAELDGVNVDLRAFEVTLESLMPEPAKELET